MQNHPPLDFSESQRTCEEACRYIVAGTTQAKMPDLYIEGEYPIHTGTPAGRATDLEFLVSQEADAIVKEEGIEVLSYAPLQALWRSTN